LRCAKGVDHRRGGQRAGNRNGELAGSRDRLVPDGRGRRCDRDQSVRRVRTAEQLGGIKPGRTGAVVPRLRPARLVADDHLAGGLRLSRRWRWLVQHRDHLAASAASIRQALEHQHDSRVTRQAFPA
jgi:hypothetical protein